MTDTDETKFDNAGGIVTWVAQSPVIVREGGDPDAAWLMDTKGTAFPWREESKGTGGFVAHDFGRKV